MYQILAYIKFLLKSTNEHGVHSPFVYNFVKKCLYGNTEHEAYKNISFYRKELINSKETLSITDLGAGSKVFKSNNRTVKQIAKMSGSSLNRAKLLYRTVNYFKPNSILELGTSLGIATHAITLGAADNAKIISIEGCPNCTKFTKSKFRDLNIKHVDFKIGEFSSIISKLSPSKLDLVFFDGNHNKEATLNYFNQLVTQTDNDSLFIFDDIHWSKEMSEAWELIKSRPEVTVTIDTFYWGFVFFRKEQVKEHFAIRL